MSTNESFFSTLRVVSSSGQPSSNKRRIAQHACDRCRRRDKRCFHGDNAGTDGGDNGHEAIGHEEVAGAGETDDMRLTIDLALVFDSIVLIQALTTMSLFVYGRESLELTSRVLFHAVQLAYAIGLHQPGDAEQDEKVAGLFGFLWSIDHLHAAIQGRPVVMHEVDMAKNPLTCAENPKKNQGLGSW